MSTDNITEVEAAVLGRHVPTERATDRGSAETAQAPGALDPAAVQTAVLDVIHSDAFLTALTEVLRAQAGLIPTAAEVARAIREYDRDQAVPAAADRTEGHPTDPVDGLS